MKKKVFIGIVLVLTFSMTAAAWDVLGHAFIMEQIKGGPAAANGNEVYGITTPDFVNYLIGTPYYEWLYEQTHTNFMRVWRMAGNGKKGSAEQALAMGFVAHNGVWGADRIAHSSSLTIGDPDHGYVIAKAAQLEQTFTGLGIWAGLGIDGEAYLPLRLELCHNIIEYVVDIKIWMTNPGLAQRVVAAAAARDASMQKLVKTAYAGPLTAYSQQTEGPMSHPAALALLQAYESAFQERVVLYAGLYASATSLESLLANLDGYLRFLASTVFKLELAEGQAGQLLGLVLQLGLTDDVGGELAATVDYVRDQLAAHNVVYGAPGHANMMPASEPKSRGGK